MEQNGLNSVLPCCQGLSPMIQKTVSSASAGRLESRLEIWSAKSQAPTSCRVHHALPGQEAPPARSRESLQPENRVSSCHHRSLFIVHYSSFIIHRSSFIVHHSSFIIFPVQTNQERMMND